MILLRKLSEYVHFSRRCIELLSGRRAMFVLFIALSFVAAMTEGFSIALLVPVIEAQGQIGAFRGIPLLGDLSGFFVVFSPNDRIKIFAAAMALIIVLRGILSFFVDSLGATMPLDWEQKLDARSYAALMAADIDFITDNDVGTMLNGVSNWPRRVSDMLSNFAIIVTNAMIICVYLMLMLLVTWKLTLLALVFIASVSMLLKFLTSGPLHRAGERMSAAVARVNQVVVESLSGMKHVRLSSAEGLMTGLYLRRLAEFISSFRQTARIQALAAPLLTMSAGLFICALLFAQASLHDGNSSSWLNLVLLFLFFMFRLTGPVSSINMARSRIVANMHAFTSLMDFYGDAERRRQSNGTVPAGPLRQDVRFEHVTFRYKPDEAPVVKDLTATIERGQMVAIVGPSGAGKSTLMALIARLYDPQQGRILIDGIDLRDLDVGSWRRRLAVVAQDVFIFNETVAHNIRLGRDQVPMQRVREAAELAVAAEFIDALPQGYDTMLGDRGVRLSGGQQQRIAIARALLAEPDVLIFDEATSNLDTVTERAIQRAIEQMSKTCTVIVIAHRLSTIRRADKIILLEAGSLREEGTHRELLRLRGTYWEMVEHQRLDLVEGDAEEAVADARA